MQVRVPAPRRFVLIGDPHQAGQPDEVLHPGDRVVHPRVPGMLMQIGHRCGDGVLMGGGEGQVETVHALLTERPPPLTVRCDSVVEPGRRESVSTTPPATAAPSRPHDPATAVVSPVNRQVGTRVSCSE
jgi:hypothetical protein